MITVGQAKKLYHGRIIYIIGKHDSSGEPSKCRVMGKVQLWKTRPQEFKIPVARGLYDHGYVTNRNAGSFTLRKPVSVKPKPKKVTERRIPWPYFR